MSEPTLREIAGILDGLPPADEASAAAASAAGRRAGASAAADSVLAGWIAGWQRRYPPRLDRPRIALFAAAYESAPGAAARARDEMAAIQAGEARLYGLCEDLDADLRVYEMALDRPARNSAVGPALTETDAARAIAYGMMAVDDGTDVVGVGAFGGGEAAAAAVGHLLLGGEPDEWGGKVQPLPRLDGHQEGALGALQLAALLGGEDIAAMIGTLIAARVAGVPALLEGPAAFAAAAVLGAAAEGGAGHCAMLAGPSDPMPAVAFHKRLPAARLNVALGAAGRPGRPGATGEALARGLGDLQQTVAAFEALAAAENPTR